MIKCYGTLNSLSTNYNPSVYPLTTTWQKLFLLLTKYFHQNWHKARRAAACSGVRVVDVDCRLLQCCCCTLPALQTVLQPLYCPHQELTTFVHSHNLTREQLLYSFRSDKGSLLIRNTLDWFYFSASIMFLQNSYKLLNPIVYSSTWVQCVQKVGETLDSKMQG